MGVQATSNHGASESERPFAAAHGYPSLRSESTGVPTELEREGSARLEADDDHHRMMNGPRIAQALGLKPRHYHDAPTIRKMLDKMEEKRTCDAPCLVAMLRLACDALKWYDEGHSPESRLSDNGEHAQLALESIERGLWATSPRELWFETPDSKSLGGGGLGFGENATPKEATDTDSSSATESA